MSIMNPKRILVIGGGFSGIGSIAHIKAEGMEPVCYEKSDKHGGTWCYREEANFGQASIMPTTIINHSKEMGAISIFPPRKEFNNYMRHSELYQYMTEFMEKFDCERFIRYNTEVILVKKSDDYEKTGRWTVVSKNLKTDESFEETFDGVLVATGHINRPLIPTFRGQENFRGKIIHTHSLKHVEKYTGQNIVVVGMGCSALDAAVELSRVAKQVYLSTRSGSFVWNRVGRNGYPIDSILLRRYITKLLDILPIKALSWYLETFYTDVLFDHTFYYTKPKYHVLSKEPTINDHLASKLLSGLVIQKGDIKEFNETGLIFEEDINFTDVDTVVMATGYSWGFPFLEEGVITKDKDRIDLYKCMYPPHLPHPTLAVIGFLNPYGPGFPLGEMQIRWATYLLAGHGNLPPKETMMKDIMQRYERNKKRYCPSDKISIRVDYVQYLDEIAEQMGVKPNLLKYLFTDITLFLKLAFGPCLSYQYRLEGHGKWEGARNAIMTAEERMQWPLRRRNSMKKGFLRYIIEYLVNIIPVNIHIWG